MPFQIPSPCSEYWVLPTRTPTTHTSHHTLSPPPIPPGPGWVWPMRMLSSHKNKDPSCQGSVGLLNSSTHAWRPLHKTILNACSPCPFYSRDSNNSLLVLTLGYNTILTVLTYFPHLRKQSLFILPGLGLPSPSC